MAQRVNLIFSFTGTFNTYLRRLRSIELVYVCIKENIVNEVNSERMDETKGFFVVETTVTWGIL